MLSLGINYGSFHDASAAIAQDGEVLFAIAEERVSRKKHDGDFPRLAIDACLKYVGVQADDLDAVTFGWQSAAAIRRSDTRNYISGTHPMRVIDMLRGWTVGVIDDVRRNGERLFTRHFGRPRAGFGRIDHHYAHALSAYPVSGFDEATVVVIDGRGAWEATSVWHGRSNNLKLVDMQMWPDSLGLFYAEFTAYLGFQKYQDEWKVMGLAPYGKPGIDLADFITVTEHGYNVDARKLLALGAGGRNGFWIEERLGPARHPDAELTQRDRDLAWAVQDVCERAELALIANAVQKTGCRNLCLAGGVALNSKANGLIVARGLVDRIFIQPAASDDGVAIGAALAPAFKAGLKSPQMNRAYLGPQTRSGDIEAVLKTYKLPYERVDEPTMVTARLLAEGALVGWYQGREEFGPRALGNRSILADPRDPANRDRVNNAVKFREEWRPFAPSVLEEAGPSLFEVYHTTPFMTLTFQVKESRKHDIAAAVHVDGSARVQSVTREQNERYYDLIKNFAALTGVPALLNTSFNLKGEAIVNTPFDAIRTFYTSGLDALVLDHFIIRKTTGGRQAP